MAINKPELRFVYYRPHPVNAHFVRVVEVELSDDECRVIMTLLDDAVARIQKGREAYGPLELTSDTRDFVKEANEEVLDNAIYLAMDKLRKERKL